MITQARPTDFSKRGQRLKNWFASATGKALLAVEQRYLEQALPALFGYYACQLTVIPAEKLLAACQIKYQFAIVPDPASMVETSSAQVVCDPYGWPIEPNSLDLVLLHHVLDIAESPHRLLSETAQTIIPNGKLLIIGFNPWSLGYIARWLLPSQRAIFRGSQCIHASRMQDWLTLLGFHVEYIRYGGYLHPLDQACKRWPNAHRIEQRCAQWHLPLGSMYLLLATREVAGTRRLVNVWSPIRQCLQPITRPTIGCYGDDY